MMAPLAREVHALPGRTRLRIDEKRGDEAYFTTVESALRDYPGILAVETNSRTASVLVHHTENDPSPWQRAEEQDCSMFAENEAEMRKTATTNLRNNNPSQESHAHLNRKQPEPIGRIGAR